MRRSPELPAFCRSVENEYRRRVMRENPRQAIAEVTLEIDSIGEHVHVRLLAAEIDLGPRGRDERIARRFECEPRALCLARAEIGAQNEVRCLDTPPGSIR